MHSSLPSNGGFNRIDRDTITFKLSFKPNMWQRLLRNKIGEGKNDNNYSALTRPFRQLIATGKPIGKINYIFFKGNRWPTRVLGTLCFTPGGRFLFFPGLTDRKINWSISGGKKFSFFFNYGFIDHFTLEENLREWHTTIIASSDKSKVKLPAHMTLQVGKDIIFWFGLTIQDPDVLETTPEEHSISFPCHPQDSKRRIKQIIDAREGSIFHMVHLPEKVLIRNGEFVHFDFFIANSSIDATKLPCHVPKFEPMVQNFCQVDGGTPLRSHPVMLPGIKQRFWIIVSKHRGKVGEKSIITTA
jgi:hypothetical protein